MAMPACENPVFWLLIRGLFFPLDECFADARMDRNRLLRGFRFARPHKTMHDGTRHVHCSCRKIDIAHFRANSSLCRMPVDAAMKTKVLSRIFNPSKRVLISQE